jgi:beta-1,4-mannosyl-glycoprotein beta-1,4-N-acetylglucosaminyltransferase
MIYDCFTYFNEIELLELRLKTLSDFVDYFVLVEANKTFTNKDKEFHFENNKQHFGEFLDRIIHIKVEDMPNSNNAWDREAHQRNCIVRGLQNCRSEDLILISDIDEIPNPVVLTQFLQNKSELRFSKHWLKNKILNLYYRNDLLERHPAVFEQDFFYYFLNCKMNKKWCGSFIIKFKHITKPLEELRTARIRFPKLKNGGWHFSYLGGVDRIIQKLKSFSHTEFDVPEITSADWVESRMKNGQGLFGDNQQGDDFEFIALNNDFPSYINCLIQKYPYLYYNKQ